MKVSLKANILFMLITWGLLLTMSSSPVFAPAFSGSVLAESQASEFMPVAEIKPGMEGKGKTVVEGTKIEEFDVEILGVLPGEGGLGDLILVRTHGKVIERLGGIAAGMSGSPVYIRGKLIGAIAYGYQMSDHTIGLVTPIGEMLRVWDARKPLSKSLPASNTIPGAIPGTVPDKIRPISTPVMISGVGPRVFDRLSARLKEFGLTPVRAGGVGTTAGGTGTLRTSGSDLVPGSALGVQLVRGDMNITAIGTVTYKRGNSILAFGHPFLAKGKVGLFATTAYIHRTVHGMLMPFKVGSPVGLVGTVDQDRPAGISAEIGKFPAVVPIRITVYDKDLGRKKDLAAQIVKDEDLTSEFALAFTLQSVDGAVDRIGKGTSRVHFEIMGRNMPEVLKRDNVFYNSADIAMESLSELAEAIDMIVSNEFTGVDIMDIKVSLEIEEKRYSARIEEADVEEDEAKPGDTVHIRVVIKPFRGERETRVIPVEIPEDILPGPLFITIRGGGASAPEEKGKEGKPASGKEDRSLKPSAHESLAKLIADFSEREKNNDIVAEFMPDLEESNPNQPGESKDTSRKKQEGEDEPLKFTLSTPYVIEGSVQVELSVVAEETTTETEEEQKQDTQKRETGAHEAQRGGGLLR